MNETGPTQSLALTSVSWVHSKVYGLDNIHCIRYLTAVDSSHPTCPPVKKYHTLTCGCMEVPLGTTARNCSSIEEVPVPYSIRSLATGSLVSYTAQGINTFTNLLQGHKTVVLICCTSEWEPDTCTGEEEKPLSLPIWYSVLNLLHIWKPYFIENWRHN